MGRLSALGAAALGALALGAAPAGAAKGAPLRLSNAQVLRIALRVAGADGDAHPTGIAFARGRLAPAVRVFDPRAHPTARGLKALGGARSVVDLVAMHGRFKSKGSHPHSGRVLELIMNAHSGEVFGVSIGPTLLAQLSRLG